MKRVYAVKGEFSKEMELTWNSEKRHYTLRKINVDSISSQGVTMLFNQEEIGHLQFLVDTTKK